MAKASELLSKLERTSRRNDLVSAIAYNILERTKCDPNLLEVEFEDLDNDNPIFASFTYTFINEDNESIVWEEDKDPDKTIDDDFRTRRYQQFITDIINDVCDRECAKKKWQEELDRRATAILQAKSNPILTQSQIEAIKKAGGIAIPDDEEVLLVNLHGGMYSTREGKPSVKRSSLWYTRPHDRSMQVNDTAYYDPPTEVFNIPDEKIIAVFPTPDGNGPVYITAPRGDESWAGDEFWYRKTTFVHGDKKIPNLWLAMCDGPRYRHYFTTPRRSALCLAIEAVSGRTKNCSGPIR